MKPLVSCLCVTKNRPDKLARAIQCLRFQTYSNIELVVVYESNDLATANIISIHKDIRLNAIVVDAERNLTLGELRNISIESAAGDFFCQWDDDDWYHPERVELQLREILETGKMACLLSRWHMFDSITGQFYLSHYRMWEGSILCNLNKFRNKMIVYPSISKSEDTSVIEILHSMDEVCLLDLPYLYIYTFHGSNTWDVEHFKMNWNKGIPISFKDVSEFYGIS
ncbi:glycosyltransferase family A protein [Cellvibrio sp. PSBB023]|uniref:glycosyltransferase family 2 protein n=1 Tax=Cellvibrio sp. PSBB023 TaxID=1945512 RepID=UPI00098E8859|nr:glycosyltransferase family A protein [Cellvibrio sp. PSBB023]AQT60521.1 hypothetical protein B0D95_10790 [Cellvibrio sp. PSBB023]